MNNERRKAIKAIFDQIEPAKNKATGETLSELADAIQQAIAAFNSAKADVKSSLEEIRDAEQEYLDNMPENMQQGEKFDIGTQAVSDLDEAIDMLEDTEDFEGFDKDDIIGKLDEVAGG